MQRRLNLSVAAAAGLAVITITSAAHATFTTPAVDQFNYATGPLATNGSATDPGWSSAWGIRAGVDGVVATPGLSSPVAGITTAGNKFSAVSPTNTIQSIRALSESIGNNSATDTESTIWISFIGQKTNAGTRLFGLGLFADNTATGAEKLSIGAPSGGGTGAPTYPNWSIYSGGLATTLQSSGVDATTLIFGVVEIDYGAAGNAASLDTAYFYVNPSTASTPSHASANATLTADLDFGAIRLAAGQTTGGNTFTNVDFDELHVGTTFGSVVPEPASLAVMSLSLGGLAMRRRKA